MLSVAIFPSRTFYCGSLSVYTPSNIFSSKTYHFLLVFGFFFVCARVCGVFLSALRDEKKV